MFSPTRTLVVLPFLLGLGMVAPSVYAQQNTVKTVPFKSGKTTTKYSGTVRGYDTRSYKLTGKSGQKISVKLTSKSTFLYFNILSDRTKVALETNPSPREVTAWSGVLPENGSYTIQVYLVRAEARRKRTASFQLSLSTGGGSSGTSAPVTATASLAGTTWRYVQTEYNNDKIVMPHASETLTLAFGKDGRITGQAGINHFNGSYKVNGDRSMTIGPLASTRAANPTGSVAEPYLRDLASANHYLFDKGFLILQLPVDAGIMKFQKSSK